MKVFMFALIFCFGLSFFSHAEANKATTVRKPATKGKFACNTTRYDQMAGKNDEVLIKDEVIAEMLTGFCDVKLPFSVTASADGQSIRVCCTQTL